jgi:3D (Asp-Asp-Asp) domain-containing protein
MVSVSFTAVVRCTLVVSLSSVAMAVALPVGAERWMPGRFLLTQYWIAEERGRTSHEQAVRVYDPGGSTVTWACRSFVASLTLEGTGRTWDGRLLNWASRNRGRVCFTEVDTALYPYGVGVQGYALVPYRSLAVDPRFIPMGHVVELLELRGLQLPDGSRHDGCFVAVDTGSAIRGHHVDLFLPSRAVYESLAMRRALPRQVTVVVDSDRCAHARRHAVQPSPDALPADPTIAR